MKRKKLMAVLAGIAVMSIFGPSQASAQSTAPNNLEVTRGNGGCYAFAENVSLEDVYRQCVLEGVTLTPKQESIVQPALQRFTKEIETTFFKNPRPTYERFFTAVKPVLRQNQSAQVRSHINSIMRGFRTR
jgi:hypothetical protein